MISVSKRQILLLRCHLKHLESISFNLFAVEVKCSLYAKLLPLCLDLDYYLVRNPSGKYPLEFNLAKFPMKICYEKLYLIRVVCLNEAKESWFIDYVLTNCNLGTSVSKVKDGFRNRS